MNMKMKLLILLMVTISLPAELLDTSQVDLCSSKLGTENHYAKFEVFTAVTMKDAVFWDVAPCRSCEPALHRDVCSHDIHGATSQKTELFRK
jgi:hypothetical protein